MRSPRKSTPKVRGGKVQRKNRTDLSSHYTNYEQERPVIDRLRPGQGYRHVLLKRDVRRFIKILPDWSELSVGLNAIVLASGERDCMGWHTPGIVAICAWERDLAGPWHDTFVEEHREILDRLHVPLEPLRDGTVFVHWTESSIKSFQLLHILLHELGHHHDRMTTKSQVQAGRGENYAETYAFRYADQIWEEYDRMFGG